MEEISKFNHGQLRMQLENKNIKETAVLLATYNGEKFLAEQLDSLVNQTYQNFVCYIHDDGSNDATKKIIEEYCRNYPNMFINLTYDNKYSGAVGNFISLIKYAINYTKEEFILFCDQDDVWLPDKIETEISTIKKYNSSGNPVLVYCDQIIVSGNLDIIAESGMAYSKRNKKDIFTNLAFENSAAGCVICINRSLLINCGKFSDANNIVMHDWWLMLVASIYDSIYYIDKPMMLYRQHGNNTLGAERKNLNFKVKKYFKSISTSVKNKNRHVKKCERQIIELKKVVAYNNKYYCKIDEFCEVLKKNKIKRMIYFLKNGYISKTELFTLFFV